MSKDFTLGGVELATEKAASEINIQLKREKSKIRSEVTHNIGELKKFASKLLVLLV